MVSQTLSDSHTTRHTHTTAEQRAKRPCHRPAFHAAQVLVAVSPPCSWHPTRRYVMLARPVSCRNIVSRMPSWKIPRLQFFQCDPLSFLWCKYVFDLSNVILLYTLSCWVWNRYSTHWMCFSITSSSRGHAIPQQPFVLRCDGADGNDNHDGFGQKQWFSIVLYGKNTSRHQWCRLLHVLWFSSCFMYCNANVWEIEKVFCLELVGPLPIQHRCWNLLCHRKTNSKNSRQHRN